MAAADEDEFVGALSWDALRAKLDQLPIEDQERFRRVLEILADKPDMVTITVPRMALEEMFDAACKGLAEHAKMKGWRKP